jgi:hypothetical protein
MVSMTTLKVSELQLANNWYHSSNGREIELKFKLHICRQACSRPITDEAHDLRLIASLGDIISCEAEVSALWLRQMQLILLPLILLPLSLT